MTTTRTRDGAREKELEELGVRDPVVEWLDNDVVVVTMKRGDLDDLTGRGGDLPVTVPYGYHADWECDHDDCGLGDYDDGYEDGHAAAIKALKRLAGAA